MMSSAKKARIAIACLASATLCVAVWHAAVAQHAASGPLAGDLQFAATQQEFEQEGQLSYAQRPSDVQSVMNRMYGNSRNYRTFSGLLVDHQPGQTGGSVWVNIAQPASVRTDAFTTFDGVGSPVEQTDGKDGRTIVYSPAAQGYIVNDRPSPQGLVPLSEVPLSVVQVDYSATSISAIASPPAILAGDFTHPAAFLTSPFYTDKKVTLTGSDTVQGRPAWVLDGRQIAGTPMAPQLGDGWKVWVDKQTGVILRFEYYSGATLIGWAAFENVSVDGNPSPRVGAFANENGRQAAQPDAVHKKRSNCA